MPSKNIQFHDMAITNKGNMVFVGYQRSGKQRKYVITKMNKNGKVAWQKVKKAKNKETGYEGKKLIAVGEDDVIVFAKYTVRGARDMGVISRVDPKGKTVWSSGIDDVGSWDNFPLLKSADGNEVMFLKRSYSNDGGNWILHYGLDGKLTREAKIPDRFGLKHVFVLPDASMLFVDGGGDYEQFRANVARYNPNTNEIIWQQDYWAALPEGRLTDAKLLSNGSLLAHVKYGNSKRLLHFRTVK